MAIKLNSDLGNIYINKDVIARIVGVVATKCYGVVGMAVRNAKDGFTSLLKGDAITKGVKITAVDGALVVNLNVIMEYGVNIKVISNSIINNVKYTLENVTGLKVSQILVNVENIRVD